MKAIVVTDEAAGTAGMTLVERPKPEPAINDVIVQVHASGFVPTEIAWPSTWVDRRGRDRTPVDPWARARERDGIGSTDGAAVGRADARDEARPPGRSVGCVCSLQRSGQGGEVVGARGLDCPEPRIRSPRRSQLPPRDAAAGGRSLLSHRRVPSGRSPRPPRLYVRV